MKLKHLASFLVLIVLLMTAAIAFAWSGHVDPSVDCVVWDTNPSHEGNYQSTSGSTSGTWGNSNSVNYSFVMHFGDGDIPFSGTLFKPEGCTPPPSDHPNHPDTPSVPPSNAFCVSTRTPFSAGDTLSVSVTDINGNSQDFGNFNAFFNLTGKGNGVTELSLQTSGNANNGQFIFTFTNQNGATFSVKLNPAMTDDIENHGCEVIGPQTPAPVVVATPVVFGEGTAPVLAWNFATWLAGSVQLPSLNLDIPALDGTGYVSNNVLQQPLNYAALLGDDVAIHQGGYASVGSDLNVGDNVVVNGVAYTVSERLNNVDKLIAAQFALNHTVLITCDPSWNYNVVFVLTR